MNLKTYKQLRAGVAVFVGVIVAMATTMDSYVLAAVGVLTGMLFMGLVKAKAKIRVDEREVALREKAAQMTYAIFAPTIGIGAFCLILLSRKEYYYLEALGTVLAYLALFMIALYAISYHFFNLKYGGSQNEE